jgi:hypothetical protein
MMLAGVICCAAGIACFLAVARPHGGQGTVTFADALPMMAGLAAVLAGCLAVARRASRHVRAVWLAIACGVDFGVSAFLLKIVPDTLPEGFSNPLRQWPLYVIVVIGPVGFLLNQSAFQAGVLIAPVLAVITALDPLVSIGIAQVWLNETIASSPLDLAAEALSLAVMTGGIIALAHRAPQVARRDLGAVRLYHPCPHARPGRGFAPGRARGASARSRCLGLRGARPIPALAPVITTAWVVDCAFYPLPPYPPGSRDAHSSNRAWTNACGRFPRSCRWATSYSSASRPGGPQAARLRSKYRIAASSLPCWCAASAMMNPQSRKAPSASPSGRWSWRNR